MSDTSNRQGASAQGPNGQASDREARTFFVETRFQRLARRPGGLSRTQALENAQAKIEETKPEFEAWLDGELRELTDLVAKGVQTGAADPAWAAGIVSHCGQLRDIGTTMGYTLLSFIAGNLCEILESTNTDAKSNIESIMCHLDALLLARQAQYRDMRPEQLPELTGGLRRVAEFIRLSPDEV
jgi:hypothetical protein